MKDPNFTDPLDCNDAAPYKERQDFMEAVKEGDLEKVRATVAIYPQAVEWATDSAYTAVQRAIYCCKPAILEFLLENGASINRRGLHGTPLIHAVHSHDRQAVKWLLEQGADAALKNPEGETALMWAILNQMIDLIPVFVKAAPVTLNLPDNDGNTPLSRAAEWGYDEEARVLLKHGARPDTRNNAGETPAELAKRHGHDGIAGVITGTIAEIARTVHDGLETPLTIHRKPLQLKKGLSL
ncbi:MAG: ankyrin repeat domain-containing protein [Alphaproteobacteria bacterium]|nr:MAG: ankyrin repeat domain-containing protein [Alphaproteobacteria bacterium]